MNHNSLRNLLFALTALLSFGGGLASVIACIRIRYQTTGQLGITGLSWRLERGKPWTVYGWAGLVWMFGFPPLAIFFIGLSLAWG